MTPRIQLTELGAVNPYGICIDDRGCLWIASKGGLFRLENNATGKCLFSDKHDRPRAMSAFSTAAIGRGSDGVNVVFTKFAEANTEETTVALYGMDGQRLATNIIEGIVKSACMTSDGNIFLTMRSKDGKNEICKTTIDEFYTFTTIVSSDEFQFLHIAASTEQNVIVVSAASAPLTPYSTQQIQLYEYSTGKLLKNFGDNGKENGQIWCPRAVEIGMKGDIFILDKTGRIQTFSQKGEFLGNIADVPPAGLANGFCIDERQQKIYISCSGLLEQIVDEKREIYCNDWIEEIPITFQNE